MRPAFGSGIAPTAESLNYARQFGATDIVPSTEGIPSVNGTWALQDLVKLRISVENFGLSLSAIENVPLNFYDHIMKRIQFSFLRYEISQKTRTERELIVGRSLYRSCVKIGENQYLVLSTWCLVFPSQEPGTRNQELGRVSGPLKGDQLWLKDFRFINVICAATSWRLSTEAPGSWSAAVSP